MVKLGLDNSWHGNQNEIHASPYSLAAHLGMAIGTYSVLLWTGLVVSSYPVDFYTGLVVLLYPVDLYTAANPPKLVQL